MPTYKYKFCDGTVSEVEVSDEYYALLKELDEQDKENNRRNKRQTSQKQYIGKSEVDVK